MFIPIDVTKVVQVDVGRIPTIPVWIVDFKSNGATTTHVCMLDDNGGMEAIPIPFAQHQERKVDGPPLATFGDIHQQTVDGNLNVQFNAKGNNFGLLFYSLLSLSD